MRAIYRKEIKTFFGSMLGWVFLAVNLFFGALYFRANGLILGYPYVSYVISGVIFIFLCSLPIISMRTFAEEARLKTDQLLFTSPVPIWKIILGKYLALVTLLGIICGVFLLFPLIQTIFGPVPWGENILALLGFFIFGMTCIAIGMLLSSITENQVIAAVLTFFILIVCVMIPGIVSMISPHANLLTRFIKVFDIYSYLEYMLYGEIYLPAFFYYFSAITVCLYAAGFILMKKRWTLKSHGFLKLLSSVGGVVAVIVLLIIANMAINTLPLKYTLKDLTYNRIYSLSKDAKKKLDKIDKDVTLYYITDDDVIDNNLNNTLSAMCEYNSHLSLERVSPTKNPTFYTAYTDVAPNDGSVIAVCGDRSKVIDYGQIYNIEYQYEYDYTSGKSNITDYKITGYDGEGMILSGIDAVINNNDAKVYVLVGHDEYIAENDLFNMLKKANLTVEEINLINRDEIPADCELLMVLGPDKDLSKEDVAKIEAYLEKGNNAIFVTGYTDTELKNYYKLLERYNIKVEPGYVMDTAPNYYDGEEYLLLPEIIDSDVTSQVYNSDVANYVYMPFAKGMTLNNDNNDIITEPIFVTTKYAYTVTNDNMEEPDKSKLKDYVVGLLATRYIGTSESNIAVIGSTYYLKSDFNQYVYGNNYTVLLNIVDLYTNTELTSVVPVKKYQYPAIRMSELYKMIFTAITLGVIPIGIIMAGIFYNYVRKHRQDD